MSILIKGMEMPKDGALLCLKIYPTGIVRICFSLPQPPDSKIATAIPISDHGDLIDRDAMAKDLAYDVEMDEKALDDTDIVGIEREKLQFDKDCKQNCMYYLTEREAIIPAERNEE